MSFVTDKTKPHLGGNIAEGDSATWCPSSWKYIIEKYQIKSVMDVGSGMGHAAKWFYENGLEVTAVEGLKENVDKALFPTISHDLTEAPFHISVDLVNCIEVVEHIEEKFLENLLTTLCQGKYLFMTHAVPGQGGWHHVNEQHTEYWINHLKRYNFELFKEDSKEIQKLAKSDGAKHITRNGMLFIKK
jgi:2-polyprenyl-3-methyl-5-hydroxy-6-metoxy-1,4-benzoquinol methylase